MWECELFVGTSNERGCEIHWGFDCTVESQKRAL